MTEIKTEVTVSYTCPKCKKDIKGPVDFDEDYYKKAEDLRGGHLHICSCVSGGVYSVFFECPYCHEQIDIY